MEKLTGVNERFFSGDIRADFEKALRGICVVVVGVHTQTSRCGWRFLTRAGGYFSRLNRLTESSDMCNGVLIGRNGRCPGVKGG